ncbi:MAG: (d)CMP kinase [Lachnospiraceae bacterium]|nr:(d)CMP kinase [Lachnospiraceae bacterium]
MGINIAIDGPAGAGKSTVAKAVSRELGYIYVDTGALYRTIGLYMTENGVDVESESELAQALDRIEVNLEYVEGKQHVILNGEDVEGRIRTAQAGNMASIVSAKPPVREKLLDLQRDIARENDIVMDGRDIGTNILPNADVKIYLTASVAERARRRALEFEAKGEACDIEVVEREIAERDHRDMTRDIAPLRCAEDAFVVDSSDMDIDETVGTILQIIYDKTGAGA